MNVGQIIATIPGKTRTQREQMRKNATHWLQFGTDEQKAAARALAEVLDSQEDTDRAQLAEKPLVERVVQASRFQPPNGAEETAIRALVDHPGATSGRLSEVCG